MLGLLVVGLTQGVRAGLTMWGAQTRRVGETGELDAGARVLRVMLGGISASPAGSVGRGAAGTTKLEGRSDSLAFVGDLPTGLGTTRRADITLELVQERLVLRWTPTVMSSRPRRRRSQPKPSLFAASRTSSSPIGVHLRQTSRWAGWRNGTVSISPTSSVFALCSPKVTGAVGRT